MRMRHLGRFRASALGLLSSAAVALGMTAPAVAGEGPPASETVQILEAAKSGDLAVTVRGAGDDRVKFTIENKTSRRLNVVIPPGLVAASNTGQGGFQSMGLGVPTANPGRFGAFRSSLSGGEGFRSVPVAPPVTDAIGVSPGQSIDLPVPSVCLNFGVPTPTAKNVFNLMDVETYTPDVRVRRALKSLATLGTSQGVAQAAMWNVCNGMSFEQLARQSVKSLNAMELGQAARFVEALDGSSTDLVDPAYIQQGRVVIRVRGEGLLAKDAKRLSGELEGARLLGLPVRVVADLDGLQARPGTILLDVTLASTKPGHTASHLTVRNASAFEEWQSLGQVDVKSTASADQVTGETIAADLDRAIARAFVTVSTARRSPGTTTLRITNRLPMTIANLTLKAGKAGDSVAVENIGIGPKRNALVPIAAASAVADRVGLNGL